MVAHRNGKDGGGTVVAHRNGNDGVAPWWRIGTATTGWHRGGAS